MEKYDKIESLYNRDEKTHKFKVGEYRLPEFNYLKNNDWIFTEKVDGTNIRIMWDGNNVIFGGRTDNAQMPTFLNYRLLELFPKEKFKIFDDPVCLYGEGYGAKIQKGGGNYRADGVDFVLFDVRVGQWWLKWEDIIDVAGKLNIDTVPIIAIGDLARGEEIVRGGFISSWGDFYAEGLVGKPIIDLLRRDGERIIVKLKTKDFD